MLVEELLRCQIQEWYPSFRRHTIPTLILPLPADFLRYLAGEPSSPSSSPPPFLLPSTAVPPLPAAADPDSTLFPSSDDEDDDEDVTPSFPELESAVNSAIAELGGEAFPKLNWSAPKDAAWIAFGSSLRCRSFADVALLLRASDAIVHDVSIALPLCSDYSPPVDGGDAVTYVLALRKFYDGLRPESEFRCFVRRRRLIAVSQRDPSVFYESILTSRCEVLSNIQNFFENVIEPKFGLADYTFDVYLRRDNVVKLVDFNPWGAYTLPLLFSWEELEGREDGADVEMRVVESKSVIRPGLKTAVPYDYIDMEEGSGWDQFLKKAEKELNLQVQVPDGEGTC